MLSNKNREKRKASILLGPFNINSVLLSNQVDALKQSLAKQKESSRNLKAIISMHAGEAAQDQEESQILSLISKISNKDEQLAEISKKFNSVKDSVGRKNEVFLPEILNQDKKFLRRTSLVGKNKSVQSQSNTSWDQKYMH